MHFSISNAGTLILTGSLPIISQAERVPPCESLPLLNFGMGILYFTQEEDAKRFVHSDQGFMEADFLDNAEVFIVPVQRPILVGSDCGSNFREEMCKVRSLNSYVATFTRDLF
ncbi:hypothetical protein P879_10944 [Paragonimus westermani]|uniref:Uncharacterized protein n=1 Tax=Paragonimus westermani TaxID=34504 RepID=A0A8T0D4I6_9TREM|nr:hypothetical protein P879_10944 [Paragonimus westermani]